MFIATAIVPVVFFSQGLAGIDRTSERQFTFVYEWQIDSLLSQEGKTEVWVPLPLSSDIQQIDHYNVETNLPYRVFDDSVYGNRMICFSVPDTVVKPHARLIFDITRFERGAMALPNRNRARSRVQDPASYLGANRLVPIDGVIAREADTVTSSESGTLNKGRALYQHLVETMRYDKSGEGWGRGDAIFACDARRGNCTDFHSLFIGMARSLGIPARFIIGFPLPQGDSTVTVGGYHCWAEFYTDELGWVPIDASEATKHPEKREYYFGHLDPDRIAFTMGRDIQLPSGGSSELLNYFVYPYAMVDGKKIGGVSHHFSVTPK